MKASEANFLNFMQGTKQFIVPIYQRKYSWTKQQCKQLWNDIIRAGKDDNMEGHFAGSIVYIGKGVYQSTAVPQLLVIDGQQRMTTLTLLLIALRKTLEDNEGTFDITKRKITNRYLVNNDEDDDLYYKLILTEGDKDTLLHLIKETPLQNEHSKRIYENYQFFLEQIRDRRIDLNELYKGISKLMIVDISLEKDKDDPQLIFESLNSTGLDLSQADLIRNYVLMRLEPKEQAGLYTNYWHPMEKSFGSLNDSSLFDRFMRDYLTVKTGRISNIKNVYSDFKKFVRGQKEKPIQQIVEDIYQYSKYFVKLAFQTDEAQDINEVLMDINALKVDVSYPFLMEVYNNYEERKLTKDEFIEILRTVESYVFRRAICGVPTNSLNKTFSTMAGEIDKDHYLESIYAIFLMKDTYKRFPDDEELMRELMVKDVYNFRNRNYLLRKLENQDRKEIVNIESYTIEHIMPQNKNLSSVWKEALGDNWKEIQKNLLHTLGNLTLTRYNSELSDRSFKEKAYLKGGFKDSPLHLNRNLAEVEVWNEGEIIKRGQFLAKQALHIWKYPSLPEDVLSQYKNQDITVENYSRTIEDYDYLKGDMLDIFKQLSKRICNLDSSVREEFKQRYIAFKTITNFVDIIPQKSRLRLSLNLAFSEIHDPKGICRDITNLKKAGNGNVEVGISSDKQIEDIMYLIKQSFDKHRDE
ncbi:DUF262 and DUF1524 domain-containing protein [Priestia aryabhattai]|uniref:GmrSD restriction endonuclease domain-containing protein n=2 Tax=Priestia aryabhattai TaxID=412384 RepID=UPI003D28B032